MTQMLELSKDLKAAVIKQTTTTTKAAVITMFHKVK